jgi:hypothetical protein
MAVPMPKGATSKETVETRSYDKHFLWENSLNFWVAPRIFRSQGCEMFYKYMEYLRFSQRLYFSNIRKFMS